MRSPKLIVALAAVAAVTTTAAVVLKPRATLEQRFEKLKPLHAKAPPVKRGDWLYEHPERAQTFREYVASGPMRPTAERKKLYVLPIGDFTPVQQRAVEQTADYLARFFQLPVETLPAVPESVVPDEARRRGQLLTTYLLFQVLVPKRPADAVAVLGLTAADLYPAPDWNFVFGEASTVERVGVWSLFRNGEPGTQLYLLRTVKTAAHETGHMLGLQHCVEWACVMAGSNSLQEGDAQPASLCPVCQQKLAWNTGYDPVRRARELEQFFADAGVTDEQALLAHELELLQ